ncbi:hypothetical protein MINT15_33480 [Saccharomonospora viridis]|uniref:Uncharacterized protein n=1 Tax=Saccharomonospora viridis TaxID=1852 RepID=A0A837DBG2_9PSEU|nr:hypothetical protein MINT15_33480 [Saccharomonospora viridis]
MTGERLRLHRTRCERRPGSHGSPESLAAGRVAAGRGHSALLRPGHSAGRLRERARGRAPSSYALRRKRAVP